MIDDDRTFIKAKPYWVWVPMVVMLLLAAWVFFGDLNKSAFLFINGWSRYTGQDLWAVLTILSDGLVTAVLLLPFIRRRPEIIWAAIIAGLSFTVFSEIMKHSLEVPRPPGVFPDDQITIIGPNYRRRSFPSGHAAMFMAIAGIWTLYVRPIWLRLVIIVFGSLVATSRIVVGVHWPLDVLAGSFMGWGMAWPGLWLARRWKWGWSVGMMRFLGAILLLGCVVLLFPYTKMYQIIWHQRILAAAFFVVGLREYIGLWKKESAK